METAVGMDGRESVLNNMFDKDPRSSLPDSDLFFKPALPGTDGPREELVHVFVNTT